MEMPSLNGQSYPGDNRLISQEFTSTGGLALMSAHRILERKHVQGWAVRPLKWYASWVQNAETARSFYLSQAGYLVEIYP